MIGSGIISDHDETGEVVRTGPTRTVLQGDQNSQLGQHNVYCICTFHHNDWQRLYSPKCFTATPRIPQQSVENAFRPCLSEV